LDSIDAVSKGTASDVQVDATSFRSIRKMTPVRHFYVDNLLGERVGPRG